MPKRPKRSRQASRRSRLEFAAIEIVGGVLPPEIVTRIAAFDMAGQSEEEYGILRGLKLRDEIARYYRVAMAHWERFAAVRDDNPEASMVFTLDLLRDCFGFIDIRETGTLVLTGREFPIRHAAHAGKVPVVLAPVAPTESRKTGIDEALPLFGEESRGRSATQLLQDYLNASDTSLWGMTSDGSTLRLMRDNASLTRPAWIEAGLEKIFSERLFSDFSVLWLLIHSSRFGSANSMPRECALERWRERGRMDGSAAKEKLRLGVEAALGELGQGFLEDPANAELRKSLRTGRLTRQSYYQQLLRLVYRLIFLFAAEDRDLLHIPGTRNPARKAYRGGYSVGRLRERCTRQSAFDRYHDVWDGLRASFGALSAGAPELGLAALGGLFTPSNLADLAAARIANRRSLKAIWHLSWFRPVAQPMTRVNWRDMQTEELGSVYESLLELIPVVHLEAREFSFTSGDAANRGNDRKTTGTYYTPDSLVQLLLSTTLDPVLDAAEARNPSDPPAEILKLAFIDPACGSGHFLLGAARRAATRIARHRSPGTPSQEVFQHALREVVSNCVFGVDRNPMAVELCKVALWIEAVEPGKPLSFLDSRIRCGDSLIGVFDYQMLRDGVPDDAFEPLTGDDKTAAKAWQGINRKQRDGAVASGLFEHLRAPASIVDGATKILAMPEDTIEQTQAKARAWERFLRAPRRVALQKACDIYVVAFLLRKWREASDQRPVDPQGLPTTEAVWRMVRAGDDGPDLPKEWADLVDAHRVFHWPLEFPAVMAGGGFDAVIGNPPWERIKLQEQEFFAARDPEIATASNKSERDKLIKALEYADTGTPRATLAAEFEAAKRASEAASVFVRKTGRFPLTGTGDVNTYALFAEHFARLARTPNVSETVQGTADDFVDSTHLGRRPAGRAGVIVPTGIATDSSTSPFFGDLVARSRLSALYDFENREKAFAAVDSRVKFSILAIGDSDKARFAAYLLDPGDLDHTERQIELEPEDFRLMNPNTLTAPLFRARADRDLTRKLYRAAPVLIRDSTDESGEDEDLQDTTGQTGYAVPFTVQEQPSQYDQGWHRSNEAENPWGLTFQRMYDMSNDSRHFRTATQLDVQGFQRDGMDWQHQDGRRYVPLYEAKMIHHFDHRFGSYAGLKARPADNTLPEVPDENKANPDYEVEPWYWVPEDETTLRVARVPTRLKQYFRKSDAAGCLRVVAEWVLGTIDRKDLDPAALARAAQRIETRLHELLGAHALGRPVLKARFATWLGKVALGARKMQRETPLSDEDLTFIKDGPRDPLDLTAALIERKQPRWLMGWRDFCRPTDERTVIASVFPKVGAGDTLLLKHPQRPAQVAAALTACLCSITLDYICRQKIGGTHLKYNVFKQNAVLAPDQVSHQDQKKVATRVLELTYTSRSMKRWAEDLGYSGAPFIFDPDRRAILRAELDAFFAQKYHVTRDELRYILDPTNTHGPDYPTETFRGLKRNEIERYGDYRTQRLVLEAFDRLTRT